MTALSLLLALLAVPANLDVQGHRGARAVRPENTWPAFQHALAVGVTTLELDLQVTRDDRLVIWHDPFLTPERCVGPAGAALAAPVPLRSLTLAQAKAHDCAGLPNPRFPKLVPAPGSPLLSLPELFARVSASPTPAARSVRFNIETKLIPGRPDLAPSPAAFVELFVQAVEAAGVAERVSLQSFDDRTLLALAARAPGITRVLLVAENHLDHVAVARSAGAQVISPHHEWILPADVTRLHAAGVKVVPWTPNSPAAWQRLLAMGVDGLITDDPAALLAWLAARPKPQAPPQEQVDGAR
ncbi:MAG: hypothetical protein KC613_22345 [Myxococcales bacterium]|nr:hypothetical protein [Myxococcales bacterium]MCB9525829.1 glycerophosphodiester phosphodiesterase [Myxococcales bacterium]